MTVSLGGLENVEAWETDDGKAIVEWEHERVTRRWIVHDPEFVDEFLRDLELVQIDMELEELQEQRGEGS